MPTPLEEDPAYWSNLTTSGATSDFNSFDFNETNLDFSLMPLANQDQPERSPFDFELATPDHDPATSPDVQVLSSQSSSHLSEAELEQFAKSLSQGACTASPIFPMDSLSQQQSLIVSPMDYTDNYLLNAFPPLDLYAPITEEEFATMPTTLIDLSTSMAGTASNIRSHTGPAMDVDESMLTEPILSPMAYYDQGQYVPAPQILSAPAPVPSSTPVPGLLVSPSTHFAPASLSPRANEGEMGDGMVAGSPSSVGGGRTGSGSGSSDTRPLLRCPEPECHKGFPTRAQLNKHKNTHTRPFQCPVCGKRHGAKKDNDRHMWAHHPEEAQQLGIKSQKRPCPVDGCTHPQQRDDNIQRHIQSHHPEYAAKAGKATKKR